MVKAPIDARMGIQARRSALKSRISLIAFATSLCIFFWFSPVKNDQVGRSHSTVSAPLTIVIATVRPFSRERLLINVAVTNVSKSVIDCDEHLAIPMYWVLHRNDQDNILPMENPITVPPGRSAEMKGRFIQLAPRNTLQNTVELTSRVRMLRTGRGSV